MLGLSVWDVGQVFRDPCDWQGQGFDPGPSVAALIAALVVQPMRNATMPTDVTLAGYGGRYLEWSVPADLKSSAWTEFDDCDVDREGVHYFQSWLGKGMGDRYEQVPGQVDRLWVLDVRGQRLVIDATYSPDTTPADRNQLQQVVQSIRFDTQQSGPTGPRLGVFDGAVAYATTMDRQGESTIYVTAEGIEARPIAGSGRGVRDVCPRFSPDGTMLAYGESSATLPGAGAAVVIAVVDASGMPVQPVVRLPGSSATGLCPTWAPDGRSVAFLADAQAGGATVAAQGIWIGRLDGTATRIAGWEGPCCASRLDWSPDGTAISVMENSGIWAVKRDGREARLVLRAGPGVQFSEATWSPDGERIAVVAEAFVSDASGGGSITGTTVEIVRADGSGSPTELGSGWDVRWSPDGHRIAYIRTGERDGIAQSEIVTVTPEAYGARVIASDRRLIRGLLWSPAGRRLLYVVDDAQSSGAFMEVSAVDDAAPTVLAQGPYDLEYTSTDAISWQPLFR